MKILVVNLQKAIRSIIFGILVLTPVFTSLEFYNIMFARVVYTPVYIKLIKDGAFVLIIFFSIILILKSKTIHKTTFAGLAYILLILLLAMFYADNFLIFFSGLRWITPIILMFILIPHININTLKTSAIILFVLFLLHLSIQIFQLFFFPIYFGGNAWGLSLRNTGFFSMPSTGSFFSIFVLFFSLFYTKLNRSKTLALMFITLLSVLLTASGAGVIVYFSFIFIYTLKKKYFVFLPVLSLLLFFILFHFAEDLTGRKDVIDGSLNSRVHIFFSSLENISFFPSKFGTGTNSAVLVTRLKDMVDSNATILDSMFTSLIVNLGIINSSIIFIIMIFAISFSWKQKNKEKLIFFVICVLFSVSSIIFEYFPVNLLIAILGAYYLNNENKVLPKTT